jgi:hypothetical protein
LPQRPDAAMAATPVSARIAFLKTEAGGEERFTIVCCCVRVIIFLAPP